MPLPVNPPPGPVSLSANARTVLEKRYLVKNEKGKPVEQPEGVVADEYLSVAIRSGSETSMISFAAPASAATLVW